MPAPPCPMPPLRPLFIKLIEPYTHKYMHTSTTLEGVEGCVKTTDTGHAQRRTVDAF
jgi:hypothetical protein